MKKNGSTDPMADLRRMLPDLPPRLREVGRYVVEREFDAATRSMRDIAASANVQPATFTRLAQALGREGWEQFRHELIEMRRPARRGPYTSRVDRELVRGDDASQFGAAIQAADIDSLARIDINAVARAVHVLKDAPRIWIAGYRSCHGVAELIRYQMRLFRGGVSLIDPGAEDLDFSEFRADDALITISFAPYTRIGTATVAAARKAGCILVSITDHPSSPYAEGADHCIVYDAGGTPAFFPSLTSAVSAAQILVAALFKVGGPGNEDRLRNSEARLAALQQYVSDKSKR